MSKLTSWEQDVAGKAVAIVHFWIFWKQNGSYIQLDPRLLDSIRSHGSIPMITWSPEEMGGGVNQPDFQLIDIINGLHDDYIRQWASAAKGWGMPFFLRWAQEPDGDWFPWGEDANGNQRGQYVLAWQHVHDIFTSVGATNVTWVWCPNVQWSGSTRPSYQSLYPGDNYVDWIGLDGYNWGSNHPTYGGWSSFSQVFDYSYNTILPVAPSKPLMLAEWGSAEEGGSKADWITDALSLQTPANYPKLKAQVWYNYVMSGEDWRVESSTSSAAAWRTAISSTNWRTNEHGALTGSPIPAP
jgi:beta-mannanase